MRLSDFDTWAQRHHGLITLRASNLDGESWRRAIRTGTLIEVHRHVARLPGCPTTPIQAIHAAVLAGGEPAAASHRSAAMLWGLLDIDNGCGIHITMSNRSRNPRLDGVYVHRPTDRRGLEPDRRHGIACTDPIRTLCDLGADDPALVPIALEAALTAGLVDTAALQVAVAAHSQHGRGGIPALRTALRCRDTAHTAAGVVLPISRTRLRHPEHDRHRDRDQDRDRAQTLKRNSMTSPSWAM